MTLSVLWYDLVLFFYTVKVIDPCDVIRNFWPQLVSVRVVVTSMMLRTKFGRNPIKNVRQVLFWNFAKFGTFLNFDPISKGHMIKSSLTYCNLKSRATRWRIQFYDMRSFGIFCTVKVIDPCDPYVTFDPKPFITFVPLYWLIIMTKFEKHPLKNVGQETFLRLA